MENLFYIISITFIIILSYIIIKEKLCQYLFKNINIEDNVKCQVIAKNNQEDIEIILRKLLYIQCETQSFKTIEVICENQNDETYKIVEKMEEQYPCIKLIKML